MPTVLFLGIFWKFLRPQPFSLTAKDYPPRLYIISAVLQILEKICEERLTVEASQNLSENSSSRTI